MEFEVRKSDVIAELCKKKDRFPWGDHPDETYHCLVFWEDGVVRMCVDGYYAIDDDTYVCDRAFTTFFGERLEDYTKLSEEELAKIAYRAYCSGAR